MDWERFKELRQVLTTLLVGLAPFFFFFFVEGCTFISFFKKNNNKSSQVFKGFH